MRQDYRHHWHYEHIRVGKLGQSILSPQDKSASAPDRRGAKNRVTMEDRQLQARGTAVTAVGVTVCSREYVLGQGGTTDSQGKLKHTSIRYFYEHPDCGKRFVSKNT